MSNDETQPATPGSGSRWEPDPAPAPAPAAYAPAPVKRNRGGLILAGGALGVALVAGAGGFALGHATADDGREGPGRFGRQGPDGFQNFPGGGPQRGGPQGTLPGRGQDGQPPEGFPDPRDGDDDRLPDDGSTQGSST